jgi:hypothetical protein
MEDSNPKKEEAEAKLKLNESTESINTPKVNCKKMKSKILILQKF